MNITTSFSQRLETILIRLKVPNPSLHLKLIQEVFANKSKQQLIFLGEFMSLTGLTKDQTSLFFSDLSFEADPPVSPVTIPYAEGKFWFKLGKKGLVEDRSQFEIYSEINEDIIPESEISLIVAYEVCYG